MSTDHGHDHGHDHHHSHSHDHSELAPRVIVTAILVTLIFMIIEAVGGYLANSMALVSDAAHMLTDIGAMALSLFAVWVARKPVTSQMSYGYQRAEILCALLSGLLTWAIAGILIYEGITRLSSPPQVQGKTVFVIAVIGLVANFTSMRVLHNHKADNINVRAAYVHVFADMLGSLSAIVAGAVLWLTHWSPIDPIVTLLFAALMLISSWSLVIESVAVLMESAPRGVDPDQIKKSLTELSGIIEVHDLHVWSVSSGKLSLSVHLISAGKHEDILDSANKILTSRFGIEHTTIQIEHPEKFQSQHCYDCAPEA